MSILRKLLALPSFWVALLLLLLHGVLIFARKDHEVVYGDSGLMYLQARQLLEADYGSFAFDYRGAGIDPERKFLPYRKPFLVRVGSEYFIDFPPYFPFVTAPFYRWFDFAGLYLPGFIALAATFFLLIAAAARAGLGRAGRSGVLILYGLASTVPLYNYIFHEYPLALGLWAGAFLLVLRMEGAGFSIPAALGFGFLSGLAVIFRMELVLAAGALGLAYVTIVRERFIAFTAYSLLGFLLPAVFLLYANYAVHGHPLGLRYAMTIAENANPDSRWQIVYGLLFSEVRGLLRQTPYFLLLLLAPFARLERPARLLLVFAGVLLPAVLLTSPNHGDHIAPRYLFALVAPGSILIVLLIRDFRYRNFRFALALFAAILALLSFRSSYGGYRWIRSSDLAARAVLERLRRVEAEHVAFDDYGPPLNLENLYSEKIFFVVESPAEKAELESLLRARGVRRWAVAGPLPQPPPQDPRAFYEDLKTKGWPLQTWRPERIFLDPPLFVVEINAAP